MQEYIISTETTCDLPLYKRNGLLIHEFSYNIDGECFYDSEVDDYKKFYDKMYQGAKCMTSQVSLADAIDNFRRVLKSGKNILHISFSSKLSGTYNNMRIAKNKLKEEFPERKIIVIDSLCASLGLGLLVLYSIRKKNEGMSIDELAEWIENNKLRIQHNLIVDDLMYLRRGGRLKLVKSIIGTCLGIKPLLHMNNDGCLEFLKTSRGYKKALSEICNVLINGIKGYENENTIITIGHSDCIESAKFCELKIKEYFGNDANKIEFIINDFSPVIGCHVGRNVVSLFSIGNTRNI